MRFRNLLVGAASAAAAVTLALAPAAQAVTPTNIDVGGDSSNTSHAVSGTYVSGNVTMQTLFGNITVGCSSGSVSGTVNGGSSGTPPNDPAFAFTGINLNCTSFIPGTTVSMQVSGCTVGVDADDTVSGVTDGEAHFASGSQACVKVTVSNGCTLWIGGNIDADFTNSTQRLVLNGSGPSVYSNPAAPSGCSGIVSTGYALSLNNVTFGLTSPDGAITIS